MTVALPQVQTVKAETLPMRVLLYGDTGSGKTSFAATANLHPDMFPALVINFDDGLASVAHLEGVRYVDVDSHAQMLTVLGQFLKPPDQRAEGYQDIKTIIVDSISAWRDAALGEIVDTNTARDAKKGKARELLIPQIQDYGQLTYQLQSIIHGLAQLPYHLILIAGVEEDRDPTTGLLNSTQPLISPKLRQNISHMMSFIWYTRVKAGTYQLLTLPKEVFRAKTRNPKFVAAIIAETRKRVAEEKQAAAEGWWVLGLDNEYQPTPNMADLYNLYLTSTAY